MKQHITIDQLNEINDDQKGRLREWWKPVYGDFFSNGHWANIIQSEEEGTIRTVSTDQDGAYDYESKKECLPLLSIGQMFQLLDDDRQSAVPVPISQILPNYHLQYTDSLCDVLWGAVKQILKDTPTP